jgi:hypothetical protein
MVTIQCLHGLYFDGETAGQRMEFASLTSKRIAAEEIEGAAARL